MRKLAVRCCLDYAEVAGVYNYEVYRIANGIFSYFVLATCIDCGELFVIDKENPQTGALTLEQISDGQHCPKCNANLYDTLKEYPKTIRTKDGKIGSFSPSNPMPSDTETFVIEFWEIRSSTQLEQ